MSCASSVHNYFLIIVITVLVLNTSSTRSDTVNTEHSACFDTYLQQSTQIGLNYAESYNACADEDNINRQPPAVIDVEGERQALRDLSSETCGNLNACNLINDTRTFLECHSNTASTNMNKSLVVNVRAASMAIEINDQYAEEEKELQRCYLAAKQSFLNDSLSAYKQHLKCLNS